MTEKTTSAAIVRTESLPLMNIARALPPATKEKRQYNIISDRSITEQIWQRRASIRATYPIRLDCPDGVTKWICPRGMALGWNEFSNRGLTLWPEVTCWPKQRHYGLYFGWNNLTEIHTRKGSTLWPLELMVYIRERESALTRALETLDKVFPLPRYKYHKDNDVRPFAEDFSWLPRRNKKVRR